MTDEELNALVNSLRYGGGNALSGGQHHPVDLLGLNQQERSLYQHHLNELSRGGVRNADGTGSTVKQMTTEFDGRTYNLPTVWGGNVLSEKEAILRALSSGLDKFPSYKTRDEAQKRYDLMHGFMEQDK